MIVLPSFGKDYNIIDFGANPDGKTLTTEAIQKAIDECTATGGGTVTVPAGTYLTNSIFLKSNVDLHIQKGAVLLGSTNPDDFKGALVHAENIHDASITGLGVINGQGFKQFYPKSGNRHNNIWLLKCKNITVQDVTLINSSNWVFRIKECDGIIVHGIRIYSFTNENNDGIDIDGKNITISGCIIDCDDDAVCLKSDNPDYLVENISISNCIIASNCNAIKCGTGSRGGFKNISVSNCVIRRPSEAVHRRWSKIIQGVSNDTTVISGIALEVVDGGQMDQVAISNITMTGIQTPLFIRLGNRKGPGSLKNIVISNITATNESLMASSLTGIPGDYVENVILKDLFFNCKGAGTEIEASATVPEVENAYPENRMFGYSLPAYGMYVRHVKGLLLENLRFNLRAPDVRPAMLLDDCHQVRINNFSVDKPSGNHPVIRLIQSSNVAISGYQPDGPTLKFLKVEGEKSSDIKLTDNDFSKVEKLVEFDGCQPKVVKKLNNF
jgi:polygalacturonase